MSRYATNKKSPNGSGQPVATFAGIDYFKRFSYITIGDQEGKVLRQEPVPNDTKCLEKFFELYETLTVVLMDN